MATHARSIEDVRPQEGGGSRIDRRAALGSFIAGFAALAVPRPAEAASADAEILALSAEVLSRCEEGDRISAERIEPHEEAFQKILHRFPPCTEQRFQEACAYSRQVGREAAISELHYFEEITDGLFNRMMAICATTQAGRAAKVRALLVHVLRTGWRGPADELDWDKEMPRALLGEFAGLTASELEAI